MNMILITNDDGYNSNGIQLLYQILSEIDETVIVAPSENNSGIGYYHHFDKSFICNEKDNGVELINATPVDCVKIGINKYNPNLIVSGINIGHNLGATILLCSGTFMSALEGYRHNIKSLSLSMCDINDKFLTLTNNKMSKVNKDKLKDIIYNAINEDFKLANMNLIYNNYDDYNITNVCDTIYDTTYKYDFNIKLDLKKKYIKGTDIHSIMGLNKHSLSIIE